MKYIPKNILRDTFWSPHNRWMIGMAVACTYGGALLFIITLILKLLGIGFIVEIFHIPVYILSKYGDHRIFFIMYYFTIGGLIFYPSYRKRIKVIFIGKYDICPNCNQSIRIYEKWRCNFCNRLQDEERYIFEKCKHCHRRVDVFLCEHCHEEIIMPK